MSRIHHIAIAATLIAAVALGGVGPAQAATLQAQKVRIVENVLERSGRSEAFSQVCARLEQAGALLAITPGQGEFDLVLKTAAAPECKAFVLEDGRRAVIDLHDTVNLQAGRHYQLDACPLVDAVRTSLFTVEPTFISRVVLDLSAASELNIRTEGDTHVIEIQPIGNAAMAPVSVAIQMNRAADAAQTMTHAETNHAEALVEVVAYQLSRVRAAQAGQYSAPAVAIVAAGDEDSTVPEALALALNAYPEAPGAAQNDSILVASAQRETPAAAAPNVTSEMAERMRALEGGLRSVAEAPLALPGKLGGAFAAMEEGAAEGEPEVEEAAPAPEETETMEEPLPPPPRASEPMPDASEANASLYRQMRDLISDVSETGRDVAAEEGVKTSGMEDSPAAAPAVSTPRVEAPSVNTPPNPETAPRAPRRVTYSGDPLAQRVDIDFREMDLSNVVALLAHKAGINVVAVDTNLDGTVTANLTNVPLRQAMETVLRMNGLGMVEDSGIYRIIPYEQAIAEERATVMVTLKNAKSDEVRQVVDDVISGSPDANLFSVTDNKAANVVVLAGPESKLDDFVALVHELDVAEPVLPTVTQAIKLNYAEPTDALAMVQDMLTAEIGTAAADTRARHLIVTDVPVVVEQVRQLINTLDVPVKQVMLDTMVVDAILDDQADTGVDWILESVRRQSRRDAITDPGGRAVGNLQQLDLASNLNIGDAAGLLNFGILSSEIDWRGVIQAEIRNRNGNLVSNPVLVTVENKPAKITIAQEIPYIEVQETNAGGSQTNTQFKEVGTVLEVTPRVTHDKHIIVELDGKESGTQGEFNGIPIENKREVASTLRLANGQTMFIGGLRKSDEDVTVRKVPVLGDVPVLNYMFRSNSRSKSINELLIFLTCHVMDEDEVRLNTYQENKYEESRPHEADVNLFGDILHDTVKPGEMRDPSWKWRRAD